MKTVQKRKWETTKIFCGLCGSKMLVGVTLVGWEPPNNDWDKKRCHGKRLAQATAPSLFWGIPVASGVFWKLSQIGSRLRSPAMSAFQI